jgi:hypothetical protein
VPSQAKSRDMWRMRWACSTVSIRFYRRLSHTCSIECLALHAHTKINSRPGNSACRRCDGRGWVVAPCRECPSSAQSSSSTNTQSSRNGRQDAIGNRNGSIRSSGT